MAIVERSARVRPGFRRFAIVACVLLLPVALHTAWDHYQARRLARVVADIRARNEPVATVSDVGSAFLKSPENAARYYEAAAALIYTEPLYGLEGLQHKVTYAPDAERNDVVRQVRAWLSQNEESEGFLARATDMPFEGYPPGTDYSFRFDRLFNLGRLANYRALERLEAADAERAADAIVQQLRINRPLGASGPNGFWMGGSYFTTIVPLRDVGRLLDLAPSDRALQRLQTAIREIDVDKAVEQSLLAERAFHLGMFWNESRAWYARPPRDASGNPVWYIMRPVLVRQLIKMIEIQTTLLELARKPWPERLHVNVPERPPGSRRPRGFLPLPFAEATHTLGSSYRSRVTSVATALALGRTADAAIAAERYRRATGRLPESLAQLVPAYLPKVPTDPFSGREIRYVRTGEGATAYSLGTNEKDDGGTKLDDPRWRKGGVQYTPPDFGVSLVLSSRR